MNLFSAYLPFMLFAFVASITPGPTRILILVSSQRFGVKTTLPAVAACLGARGRACCTEIRSARRPDGTGQSAEYLLPGVARCRHRSGCG